MKNIVLLIGNFIPKVRQQSLLTLFRARIVEQTLPFKIDLYDPDADLSAYQYAIVDFPPPDVLDKMSRLEFVLSLNAGVDDVVDQLNDKARIKLARLINETAVVRIGQYVCYAVLNRVRLFDRWQEQEATKTWDRKIASYHDDVAVGIMGLGKIGRTVATQLHALGFIVKGFARTPKLDLPFEIYTDLSKFMPKVNIIVITLPLTNDTKDIINADTLALLPAASCIINVGRGAHIKEDDLMIALDSGKLASVILDVFRTEPLPADHAFWKHPKVTVTPHIAGGFDVEDHIVPALSVCASFNENGTCENEVNLKRGY